MKSQHGSGALFLDKDLVFYLTGKTAVLENF